MAVRFCEDRETDPGILVYEPRDAGRPTILSAGQLSQVEELLQKHNSVFDTSPGHTAVVEHHISTGDSKPVFHPPYRVPSAWQESVREEIGSMLRAGIIVPSKSPWTSPIVPVKKKDCSLRLCVDYRRLNQVTAEDRYPMPRVEELLEQLGKAKYITTLDLTQGYYQVSVASEDRSKTAFMAPMGSPGCHLA
jgi:hypothetical protein